MNHLTEAEAFRARLNRLSRPQLEEAIRYLHIVDPGVMDRALEFAATPFGVPADEDPRGYMRSAMQHLALTGAAPQDPLTVDCPACHAPEGERCFSDFGCIARFSAAQVTS